MGFSAPLFGSGPPTLRYVSEQEFLRSLVREPVTVAPTLAALRRRGVPAETPIRVAFMFSSNAPDKVDVLEDVLFNMGDYVEPVLPGDDDTIFSIVGSTRDLPMKPTAIAHRIRTMCQLAYRYDCRLCHWQMRINPH